LSFVCLVGLTVGCCVFRSGNGWGVWRLKNMVEGRKSEE